MAKSTGTAAENAPLMPPSRNIVRNPMEYSIGVSKLVAAPTWWRSVEHLHARRDRDAKVVVTGLGIIGLIGAQVFQRCGYDVIACDPMAERRQIAKQVGIKKVLTEVPVNDPEYKGKVSLFLECSSFEQAVLDGCNIVRKGGEVILVGVPMVRRSDIYAQEILNKVFRNNVILSGGSEWRVPRHELDYGQESCFGQMEAALKWLAEDSIVVDGLCNIISPEEAQSVYQDVLNKRMKKLSAMFDWTKY